MNEPNNTCPKERKFSDETLDEIGGWLVVFGLVIEVILALIFHSTEPWYEQWPLVLANLVIVIGVWIEVHFGGKARAEANAKTAEANKVAATANERAAILEKEAAEARERTAEIELITAFRHIPKDTSKLREFLTNLNSKTQVRLHINCQTSDTEALCYAMEIANLFKSCEIEIVHFSQNFHLGTPVIGLQMAGTNDLNLGDIYLALIESGFEFGVRLGQANITPQNNANLCFFVGSKLPPDIHALLHNLNASKL